MTTTTESAPCWMLNVGTIGPELHQESEEAAKRFAARYADETGQPVPGVEPLTRPCVTLGCTSCNAPFSENPGMRSATHFAYDDAALIAAYHAGWRLIAGEVRCPACATEALGSDR